METIDLIALFTFGTMVITIINLLKINKMANELIDLTAEVEESNGIMSSAKTLIEGFAVKLQEAINANNPQALIDLKNSLDSKSSELAAAIAANPLPGEVIVPPVE